MSQPVPTVRSNAQRPPRLRVVTVTGQEIELQHEREKKLYEEAKHKYTTENQFTVASDKRALDRLLSYEVQAYRAQWQLLAGVDYDLNLLDATEESALQRTLKETQAQISLIQNDLGLTKAQRDKDQAEATGTYIARLKQRAKLHGIKREDQLGKALELMNQMLSICGSYLRANAKERAEMGWDSPEDIIRWMDEVARPQYDAIDEYFREHEQKFWHQDPEN